MPTQIVGNLTFTFQEGWHISQYDTWSFYRNRFMRFFSPVKAVDLLAISLDRTLYLVEVKDYRLHRRTKDEVIGLAEETKKKVLDTLAAMLPCKLNGDEDSETAFSTRVLSAERLRIVLHLEQPSKHSKLFPRAINPADIEMKMRQQLKPIDAHPIVVEMNRMRGLPWVVS